MMNLKTHEDISQISEKEQEKMIYSNMLEQKILNFDDYLSRDDEFQFSSDKTSSLKKKLKILNFSNRKENKGGVSPINFGKKNNAMVETDLIKSIKYARRIPKVPQKILDAPGIIDDFYTNILDWSSQDVIGISLLNSVYLWKSNKKQGKVSRLVELDGNCYCAIKFNPNGDTLAGGDDMGLLHIHDVEKQSMIHEINVS